MKPDPLRKPHTAPDAGSAAMHSGTASTQTQTAVQRVLSSQQLFKLTNEILIEHAGFTYRLRITQANKLILTK